MLSFFCLYWCVTSSSCSFIFHKCLCNPLSVPFGFKVRCWWSVAVSPWVELFFPFLPASDLVLLCFSDFSRCLQCSTGMSRSLTHWLQSYLVLNTFLLCVSLSAPSHCQFRNLWLHGLFCWYVYLSEPKPQGMLLISLHCFGMLDQI